jgi:hypothetical protein
MEEKEPIELLWEEQKIMQEIAEQILALLHEGGPEEVICASYPSKIQQMIEYEKRTIQILIDIRTEVRKLGK